MCLSVVWLTADRGRIKHAFLEVSAIHSSLLFLLSPLSPLSSLISRLSPLSLSLPSFSTLLSPISPLSPLSPLTHPGPQAEEGWSMKRQQESASGEYLLRWCLGPLRPESHHRVLFTRGRTSCTRVSYLLIFLYFFSLFSILLQFTELNLQSTLRWMRLKCFQINFSFDFIKLITISTLFSDLSFSEFYFLIQSKYLFS